MKLKKMLSVTAVFLSLTAFLLLMAKSAARVALQASAVFGESLPHVLIDAGHGGEDGGAVCGGVLEKEINLEISRDTADLLRLCGYDVAMTRDSDDAVTDEGENTKQRKYNDMKLRLEMYNSSPDNVVISIHQNKFTDAYSHGAQVFYSPNHEGSAALAQDLRLAVTSMLQPENERECKAAGKEIYLLKNTKVPAALVECGFLSNPEERALLVTEAYQKQMALAIAAGLINYSNTNERK